MSEDPPPRDDAPGSETAIPARWAYLGVGAAVFLAGLALWQPFPAGVWHDDGVYMMLGRSLAQGEGLRYLGVSGTPPAPKFPPVYPLTLAGLWSLVSEVGRVVAGARILNFLFLGAASALFVHYLHRRLGNSLSWAVGLTALAWLAGGLWRVALIPLSEPLFVLALVAGLVAAGRMEDEAEVGRHVGLAAFLVAFALAVHVRTAGVALAAAGVLALLFQGRRKAAAGMAGASGLVMLPWVLWSGRAAGRIPEPLRDVLGPYGGWLLDQALTDPGLYMARLQGEALDLVHRVLVVLVPRVPGWEGWLDPLRWGGLVVLVPAFLLGVDRIWARARTPVLLLLTYLGLVWLWPFRDDRLLVPLVPLLILVVVEGFRWSGQGAELPEDRARGGAPSSDRQETPAWLRLGWRGFGAVWAGAFAAVSVWSLATGGIGAGYDIRSRALVQAAEAVESGVPEDKVVGAPELWAGLHLYTGRTVAPSARFRPLDPDGPVWGHPPAQHELWDAAGLDYLVVEHGGKVHQAALEALEARCGSGAVVVVASWRGAALYHLRRSAECVPR